MCYQLYCSDCSTKKEIWVIQIQGILLKERETKLKKNPRSKVLPEKLTGFQLVKKFPAFYRTRRFIAAFTSARHLCLSWPRSIQSKPLYPTSWTPILILSSHHDLCSPHIVRWSNEGEWAGRGMWHVWGTTEMHSKFWLGHLKELHQFEDLGVDGKMVLK